VRRWARQTARLHNELAELADVRDPRWWLVAGGAALPWPPRAEYLQTDAEPAGDTFIGHLTSSAPTTSLVDALARAHAARAALRELDGALPQQPLAVTIRRSHGGAFVVPSRLDVAAFAIGDRVYSHRLAPRFEDETGELVPSSDVPFVTVTFGDEPLATARHAHRRGWRTNGVAEGPWLGLTHAAGVAIVSTCHIVVDGYGHAWLAARIDERYRELIANTPPTFAAATIAQPASGVAGAISPVREVAEAISPLREVTGAVPPLREVAGAVPLALGWRRLSNAAPKVVRFAYALGQVLHRVAGRPDAPFSPTFQIPVARGDKTDPFRLKRRVTPALASVRFEHGRPEPYEAFAARTRDSLAREANGNGLTSRLLDAARAMPGPLAWKRRVVGPARRAWLAPFADVLGGRACLSKIALDIPMPPSIAVSSPSIANDELGGCVVTIVQDQTHAIITWSGTGRVGDPALLDELLALV